MSHENLDTDIETNSSFSEPNSDSADDYKLPENHSSDSENTSTDIPSTVLLKRKRNCEPKIKDKYKQPLKKQKIKLKRKNKFKSLKPQKNVSISTVQYATAYSMPRSKYDHAMKLLLAEDEEETPLSFSEKKILETCQRPLVNEAAQSKHMVHLNPCIISRKLRELKTCLLNQDWSNMAKLISMLATEVHLLCERVLLMKYAFILFRHYPAAKKSGLYDCFLDSVVGARNKQETGMFEKMICQLPDNIYDVDLSKFEMKLKDDINDESTDSDNSYNEISTDRRNIKREKSIDIL